MVDNDFKKKRFVKIDEYNEMVRGSNETTTSTLGSLKIKLTCTFEDIKKALDKLKDIDPLMGMSMSQKTWDNMPKNGGEIKTHFLTENTLLGFGTPVSVSDMIPVGFVRNEYKSGKVTLFNLETGDEITIIGVEDNGSYMGVKK